MKIADFFEKPWDFCYKVVQGLNVYISGLQFPIETNFNFIIFVKTLQSHTLILYVWSSYQMVHNTLEFSDQAD